jgi:hypothetical protein
MHIIFILLASSSEAYTDARSKQQILLRGGSSRGVEIDSFTTNTLCQDTSDQFFVEYPTDETGPKTCQWVQENPTLRCTYLPINEKCPETCGQCEAGNSESPSIESSSLNPSLSPLPNMNPYDDDPCTWGLTGWTAYELKIVPHVTSTKVGYITNDFAIDEWKIYDASNPSEIVYQEIEKVYDVNPTKERICLDSSKCYIFYIYFDSPYKDEGYILRQGNNELENGGFGNSSPSPWVEDTIPLGDCSFPTSAPTFTPPTKPPAIKRNTQISYYISSIAAFCFFFVLTIYLKCKQMQSRHLRRVHLENRRQEQVLAAMSTRSTRNGMSYEESRNLRRFQILSSIIHKRVLSKGDKYGKDDETNLSYTEISEKYVTDNEGSLHGISILEDGERSSIASRSMNGVSIFSSVASFLSLAPSTRNDPSTNPADDPTNNPTYDLPDDHFDDHPNDPPNDTTPNDTTTNDTIPDDTSANDTTLDDTTPDDTAPDDTAPNNLPPGDTTPSNITADNITTNDTTPNDITIDDVNPNNPPSTPTTPRTTNPPVNNPPVISPSNNERERKHDIFVDNIRMVSETTSSQVTQNSRATTSFKLSTSSLYSPKTCPICLEDYKVDDDIAWSNNEECPHAFHLDCIMGWLMENDDCPLCRADYLCIDRDNLFNI